MWLRTKSEHSHGRATTGGRTGRNSSRGARRSRGEEAAQRVHDGRDDDGAADSRMGGDGAADR